MTGETRYPAIKFEVRDFIQGLVTRCIYIERSCVLFLVFTQIEKILQGNSITQYKTTMEKPIKIPSLFLLCFLDVKFTFAHGTFFLALYYIS